MDVISMHQAGFNNAVASLGTALTSLQAGLMKRYTDENKAIQLWKDNLRSEYSHIRESVYNMCYEEAYDRAHAYGYDEVASVLKDVIGFAHKLLSCASE